MQRIYFVSKNENKYEEIKEIAQNCEIGNPFEIHLKKEELTELQADDMHTLVKNKAFEAFKILRRPVIVEHTALEISAFENLPGLHTNYFYSKLGYKSIVEFCGNKKNYAAVVKSVFCICDGKKYWIGEGQEEGNIVRTAENINEKDGFGWDIIFIPQKDNPEQKTYACLKEKKNRRSMRKQAWENLLKQNPKLLEEMNNQNEDENLDELAKLIADKKVMLFIGAGISASLQFPSWEKLINELAKELGYEPELFKSYGDYMMLAEYAKINMKEQLYDKLSDTFTITNEIQKDLHDSELYKKIAKLDFPVIYTTNYDSLVEMYYSKHDLKYTLVKNISDMKEVESGKTRIMKFHGDINEEKTIVLSESQYFERMNFQSFMDIQLQADMLHYHILFLGYSLSDINIKLLWYLARKRWGNNNSPVEYNNKQEEIQNAYIYSATPNYIQKEVFASNGIITYFGNEEDKGKGTIQFLDKLSSKVDLIKNRNDDTLI